MKFLTPLCLLLSVHAMAQSVDYSLEHQANCDTAEARSLKGSQGSCRVLLTSKKVSDQGTCSGIFEDKYMCTFSYEGNGSRAAALSVFCGTAEETIIEEYMVVESIEYKVSTIISGNGQTSLIEDPNTYTVLRDKSLEMTISRSASGRAKGKMNFKFDYYSVPLTQVVCD